MNNLNVVNSAQKEHEHATKHVFMFTRTVGTKCLISATNLSWFNSHSPPASCRALWLLRWTWPVPEGWRAGKHQQRSPPPGGVYLELSTNTRVE